MTLDGQETIYYILYTMKYVLASQYDDDSGYGGSFD